jgi:hypothetical protein
MWSALSTSWRGPGPFISIIHILADQVMEGGFTLNNQNEDTVVKTLIMSVLYYISSLYSCRDVVKHVLKPFRVPSHAPPPPPRVGLVTGERSSGGASSCLLHDAGLQYTVLIFLPSFCFPAMNSYLHVAQDASTTSVHSFDFSLKKYVCYDFSLNNFTIIVSGNFTST